MTELFVLVFVMVIFLSGLLITSGVLWVLWSLAKKYFPESNFVNFVTVTICDPETVHGIKIADIKPWSPKDAKRT